MSILSSTNSGINCKLSVDLLERMGWEQNPQSKLTIPTRWLERWENGYYCVYINSTPDGNIDYFYVIASVADNTHHKIVMTLRDLYKYTDYIAGRIKYIRGEINSDEYYRLANDFLSLKNA